MGVWGEVEGCGKELRDEEEFRGNRKRKWEGVKHYGRCGIYRGV